MTTIRLPALLDTHVHMREPGGEHKESWDTGSAAALAGGISTVLAMPNTSPAVVDEASLEAALAAARTARCDYGVFAGATPGNAEAVVELTDRVAGLKMYVGQTFGDLRLDDRNAWLVHLEAWPEHRVLSIHAEGDVLTEILDMATALDRPIHICHVATSDDLTRIAVAKERGRSVTCEVTPHHLFLDTESGLAAGRAEVRPPLGSPRDRAALWERLDVIDCFATDHAPHTPEEKDGVDPPPGFPGLQTMLPLLVDAVHDGRMEFADIVQRLHTRPFELFGLEPAQDSWVEVDPDAEWVISPANEYSRCGWTPYEGRVVRGRVVKTVVEGRTVYEDGQVVATPGEGRDVTQGRK